MKNVIGIDIGGTNIRAAVVNSNGEILHQIKVKSNARDGIEHLLKNLGEVITSFADFQTECIGIGIPGIIDQKNGILTQAPNITGVKNFPLIKEIKKVTSLESIIVENDANSAALGEYWMGSGAQSNSMLMLTLGTGLGGGIVLNGELWRGEDGMAGEIGHIIIDPAGPLCNCGNNGCFESFVSAEAVRRIVNNNTVLKEFTKNTHPDDIPEKIMLLAIEGNEDSLQIWKDIGKTLGIGITSLVNLLNIDSVIIGGGLSNAWELFQNWMLIEIKKRALSGPGERLKIHPASLGDNAGIFGCAYLAYKELKVFD